MSRKLTYFDLNGLAEAIRYILHYTGKKFEDIRLDLNTWPDKDIKDSLPFGQIPLFEEDGRVLHQSIAIARYVAAGTELLPTDPWEQAVLDAAVLTVYDFHKNVLKFVYATEPAEKDEARKQLYEQHLDFFFSRFEKQLIENNGYFGGRLSWADFIFVGLIEFANLFLNDNIQKNYSKIKELVEKIPALPGVKDYVTTRKPYVALGSYDNQATQDVVL